jgi:hypothetical protein
MYAYQSEVTFTVLKLLTFVLVREIRMYTAQIPIISVPSHKIKASRKDKKCRKIDRLYTLHIS